MKTKTGGKVPFSVIVLAALLAVVAVCLFALAACVAAIRTSGNQADCPPLELIPVNRFRQMNRALQVFRLSDHRVTMIFFKIKGVFQAVFDERNR